MINLNKQLEIIIDYFTLNYPEYLKDYKIDLPFITTEYIDFDKFKNDFVMYVEFDSINFSKSAYEDDCEFIEKLLMNVFLVIRNDTVKNLDKKIMDATTGFFNLLKNKKIKISDNITVKNIDFFKYVEGNKNLVSSKFSLELEIIYGGAI